jgi:hypothetical protein
MTRQKKKTTPAPASPPQDPSPPQANPADQVAHFLIEGNSNADILEYLEAQQMTAEAARTCLQDALAKFVKIARLPSEVRRGWCLEAYRDLYRKMVSTGDYTGALRAVQELAKLSDVRLTGKPVEDVQDEIDQYIDEAMTL